MAVLASLVTAKIDTRDLDIFKVGWCYCLVSELIDKLANVRLVCAPSKHTVTLTCEGVEVLEGVDALGSILCLASRADEVVFAHEHRNFDLADVFELVGLTLSVLLRPVLDEFLKLASFALLHPVLFHLENSTIVRKRTIRSISIAAFVWVTVVN